MIATPQEIVCVGLNYRDHAEEQGVDLPERPLLFAKWPNTLIASGDPIRIPPISEKVDYEAELGVVIGRRTTRVSVDDALEFVEGYVVANDVSGRDLQFADGAQVDKLTLSRLYTFDYQTLPGDGTAILVLTAAITAQ